MQHVSFSSFCFFFFFFLFFFIFLLTPNDEVSATSALSVDIINKTCKTCSDRSSVVNYTFCSASLQEIPVSHVTNLQGLAIVAMELALQNATNTLSIIKELVNNETLGPSSLACLSDCSLLYSDGVVTLVDTVGAFLTGQYGNADAWVSAVMQGTATCEEGFQDMELVSPLTKENYSLFQLCDVLLCIMNLLDSDVKS
ncbi:PREDICTED: putative invertase inhibitor [Theobroma cacao]|uniref:Invertase inhibitor n=1 Tax=Theobroma cacao TaxID=3641 RepID=A0AB32W8L4_THECC|nr:PREDICTED: putative invertase inhibitor [Theobroma cacao]